MSRKKINDGLLDKQFRVWERKMWFMSSSILNACVQKLSNKLNPITADTQHT